MATFWERAARNSNTFKLFLNGSYFGFEDWIWALIASVPGLCIRFTFMNVLITCKN